MLPQIYSVGYGRLTPPELSTLARQLGATVIDVRANPGDRGRCKAGFRRKDLNSLLGANYLWRGDILPGFRADTTAGREWLGTYTRPSLLLCAEHAPGECHRHHTIAVPLYSAPIAPSAARVVLHVFDGRLIRADDLQAAIERDVEGDEPPEVALDTYLSFGASDREQCARPKPRRRSRAA
jgi:hypothetical protein